MGDAVNKRTAKIPELDERGYLANIRDLKLAYRDTYWRLRQALKACGEDGADAPIIKDAITDVNFAIMWMHTGRRPGSKRGIERQAGYQREKSMDPMIMQGFANQSNSRSSSTLTPEEADRLRDALEILSPQEREIYMMAYGQCIPHSEIAAMMGIKKGTVSKYVQRAHEKVSNGWQGTLF